MTKKILVVEDDQNLRNGLEMLLKTRGYEVKTAENGAKALDMLRKEDFDLIIADLIMPELDGMELLRIARKMCPHTSFIVITAYGTVESAVEAMKLGACDYILKPFKIDEVYSKVLKALEEVKIRSERRVIDECSFKCLSNSIRRSIIRFLSKNEKARFVDIMNAVNIKDSAKLSFHLKFLKKHGVIDKDETKFYYLTSRGKMLAELLS